MKTRFLSTPYINKAIEKSKFYVGNETRVPDGLGVVEISSNALIESAEMETRWYARYLRTKDSKVVINFDLAWAFASILAVRCYMAFHTGSFFIVSLGMFEILCSFPVALFLYKFIYRIVYLGNVQILSIFVVLGVGADDVFVFYDAYKQS